MLLSFNFGVQRPKKRMQLRCFRIANSPLLLRDKILWKCEVLNDKMHKV